MAVYIKLNDGNSYELSPLTVYWIERLDDIMKESAGSLSKEFKTMTDLIYQSLIRKSPELKREDLSNLLDSDQINDVFTELLVVSKLMKKTDDGKVEEEKK